MNNNKGDNPDDNEALISYWKLCTIQAENQLQSVTGMANMTTTTAEATFFVDTITI